MKRIQKHIQLLIAVLVLLAGLPGLLHAQDVIRHPRPHEPLDQRWSWAAQEARSNCARGCWVGYSIERLMEADSFIGSYSSDRRGGETLQALLYGREVDAPPADIRAAAQRALEKRRAGPAMKVLKEVALLFRLEPGAGPVQDVTVSNLSLRVRLEDLPLLWLGPAEAAQSIALLERLYAQAAPAELKEDLVSAVGLHGEARLVLPFLTQVLTGREDDEVREQATFWLAEQDDPEVLPLLERTARRDASGEVREQAVFGISRIETEAAAEVLIDLARHLEDDETREQAIFWLGQKASRKAAASLADIAENDPKVEVQKKAVFALSQMPADEAVPRLIDIARTHRNPRVRQEAIFWLGETGDARAVDALVEIVRGQ